MCDTMVFVHASREVRRRRARERGWSEEDFSAREAAQQTLEAKRQRADVILDNSSTVQHLYAQVDQFWQQHIQKQSATRLT
jgi:dephospho-CoA kinase